MKRYASGVRAAGRVCLVYLVSVTEDETSGIGGKRATGELVWRVSFVWVISFLSAIEPNEPNKPTQLNEPEEPDEQERQAQACSQYNPGSGSTFILETRR